jgi:hypothetical protein
MTRRRTQHHALRRALTRLKALTQRYAEHCRYILMAGPHPDHRLCQMERTEWRIRGAIHRDLTIAQRLAAADDALCLLAGRPCVLSDQVIEACDHFPRDQEWPGLPYLIQQHETIADMRWLIRHGSAA